MKIVSLYDDILYITIYINNPYIPSAMQDYIHKMYTIFYVWV